MSAVILFPLLVITSLFAGLGLLLLPLAFLVGILFIRSEWPLWVVGFVTILIWWNAHQSIGVILRSEASQKTREVERAINEAARRHEQQNAPAPPGEDP